MHRRVALLDANVLYQARARDLLIRLDISGLYQARWSDQILDECFRNIIENRPDLMTNRLARTRRHMNAALPAAMVDDYEELVADQDLPDPDDHHVLAAALKAGAGFLVTNNLDDFPAGKVPTNILVLPPDDFVMRLLAEDLDLVVEVVEAQAAALVKPPMTTSELLDGLAEVGLVQTVAQIRSAIN